MQDDINKYPSFCKILDKQDFMDQIQMPPDFVKENKNMLAKTCLLKTDVAGMVWKAKITREKFDFFICKEEWPQFAVHHKLEVGDTLFFYLTEKSTFQVMVYTKKSCKNFQYLEELSSGSQEEKDIGSSISSKNVKMEPQESSAHVTRAIESDDSSIEILEFTPGSHKGKGKVSENSVENIGHCSLGQSSKKRQRDDNAVDDISSVVTKGQKSNEGCKMEKQQSKIVSEKNKTVWSKEKQRSAAYQRAKSFNSDNPFFISFMQPSYVFEPYTLSISPKFAMGHFEENYSFLMLRVQGRGSWRVKCYVGTSNARITTGWKKFVSDNRLKLGDVCVFEVIKDYFDHRQLCIDVTVFRSSGSSHQCMLD